MATRAGSVDPGILVAVQRDQGLDVDALIETLEHRSGLLGVSGRSGDVRVLIAAEPTDERAALALALFVRSVAAAIAATATALPRLDAIVFTGGIGENAGELRARIARASRRWEFRRCQPHRWTRTPCSRAARSQLCASRPARTSSSRATSATR